MPVIKISAGKKKKLRLARQQHRDIEKGKLKLTPTAPPDTGSFKSLLPKNGFDWPISIAGTKLSNGRPASTCNKKHGAIILQAIRQANRLTCPGSKKLPDAGDLYKDKHGLQLRYLTRPLLEEEMARLMKRGAELLAVANPATFTATSDFSRYEFWDHVMQWTPPANPDRPGLEVWFSKAFSSKANNPGIRKLDGEVLYCFAVFAIAARLHALERSAAAKKEEDDGEDMQFVPKGRLAAAVDAFIDKLKTLHGDNQDVQRAYFECFSEVGFPAVRDQQDEQQEKIKVEGEDSEEDHDDGMEMELCGHVEGITMEEDARAGFSDMLAKMSVGNA